MKILEAIGITKVYDDGGEKVEALKDVSLSLNVNEIVTLEGPSGSGKTTFLSIAGCLLSPTSGSLVIEGVEVNTEDPKILTKVRRDSIGFVFQHFNLFPALTVLENVLYALQIREKKGPEFEQEARHILEEVGLESRLFFLPAQLSGGEKQRVAIARAIAGGSRIILADEPTANLDSHVGMEVLSTFRRLAKEENRALLIVTHDPTVRKMSDRNIRIRDGKLLQDSNA